MQSSNQTSNTTSPKSPSKVQINPNKTSSLKTKSTTVLNLSNPNAAKDLETSLEIEKISKKISEHADALYRTWKSHGLAPTEILELYNVDAGVAAGAIADDKSAEDLHKLVNTFVSKDKEQRGVKSVVGSKSKLGVTQKTEVKPKVIEHKIDVRGVNSNTNKLTTPVAGNILNSVTPVYSQSNNILTDLEKTAQIGVKKSSITPKSTNFIDTTDGVNDIITPTGSSGLNSTPKVTKIKTQKSQNATPLTQKSTSGLLGKSLTTSNKPLDIDIDFNLDLNLNLDVHSLSQQQTENLQKIKELLKESPSSTPVTPQASTLSNTKIPGVVGDSATAKVLKEVKVKKTIQEKNKQNEETPVIQKKSAIITNEVQAATKKFGNKLKTSSAADKAPDLSNQSIAIKEDKTKILDNNRDDIIATNSMQNHKKRTNLSSPTSSSSSSSNGVSNSSVSAISTSNNILTNGCLAPSATTTASSLLEEQLKSQTPHTNKSTASSSSSKNSGLSSTDILDNNIIIKTQKSNGKTIKAPKIKEKTTDKTDSPKETKSINPVKANTQNIETPATATKSAASTALTAVTQNQQQQLQQAQKSAAVIESDNQKTMETQASPSSNSSTTMPTPTKIKTNRPLSNGQDKSCK